ncbi:MAG: hypothetical protein JNL88_04050 [Bacteroidia bacterium]|nr:hypothetical protein [Bacteroidia bacterium]
MKRTLSTLLISLLVSAFVSCQGQDQKASAVKTEATLSLPPGDTVSGLGKDMDCILQDRKGHYWFASNGEGVYRYDGKTLLHLTDKEGLCSNFVLSIQEDADGQLWFSTRDGVCSYNGVAFTNRTRQIENAPAGKLHYTRGGLFFNRRNGMCYYDGRNFTGFTIHPAQYIPSSSDMNRPYSVYSTLADRAGNVWFGTQEKGVCRYDGNMFTFFTEEGLDLAAVRTLFQDREGTIWAGNNGAGVFRFNGRSFENFTDRMGLGNRDFLKRLKGKEGTLARPWTINEDREGHLWIGTIDAGAWMYDGKNLRHYTATDGLSGEAVWTIYKDRKGELWFIVNGETVLTLNGTSFTEFEFH